MKKAYVGLVVLVITASLSTACGSSSTTRFCAHIDPTGNDPAEAFSAIELWDPHAARKQALEEAKLMKGVVPPAAIAKDWQTWNTYVHAVLRVTGSGQSLEAVSGLEQRSRGAEKPLTDYAFAHCA